MRSSRLTADEIYWIAVKHPDHLFTPWADAERAVLDAVERVRLDEAETCSRCGDQFTDHPSLPHVCGACMIGTTEDDRVVAAVERRTAEIVEALRVEAQELAACTGRTRGLGGAADFIERTFLSPDNPEGNA